VFADDHRKNPMASFSFDLPTIDAGTTFIFGSWVCIANGSGGFDSHLANTMSTEAPRLEQLDGAVSAEFLLPQIIGEIEKLSLSNTLSTHVAPLRVDSIYFEFFQS